MEKGWGSETPSSPSGQHVRRPSPENELNGLNFSETDSRHRRATTAGWKPVDGNSGEMSEDTWEKTADFPDSSPWRQT